MTTEQIRNRTKTVTRRLGWKTLKAGTLVRACVKCMGLKKGEKVEPIGVIEIIDVRRESLDMLDKPSACPVTGYPVAEMRAEGFETLDPYEFIGMFCKANNCAADEEVTRIEFRHRPDLSICCGAERETWPPRDGAGITRYYRCTQCEEPI